MSIAPALSSESETISSKKVREQQLESGPLFSGAPLASLIQQIRLTIHLVSDPQNGAIGITLDQAEAQRAGYKVTGSLPPLYPEWLGDRSFLAAHKTRFPYIVGEMATGIATSSMVLAAAQFGLLGFFGAAGLSLERIEKALAEIRTGLKGGQSWGANLIHHPDDAGMEDAIVDLYLRHGVERVSASAFMKLTPAVVRYAVSGLTSDEHGEIRRKHFVFAKLSRAEVASQFMSPPPQEILDRLLRDGKINASEAQLASRVAVAEDITVEGDSGGHTDNRPLGALLPVILALRDQLAAQHGYRRSIRVGAAGSLGSPSAVASAFAIGAAYVMTGSINQCAMEAGTSDAVKKMLAQAGVADVVMAPAADMFELGVKVQVLKRGTMFAQRGARLYQVYLEYPSLEALPASVAAELERDIFRQPLPEIWNECVNFWGKRNPATLAAAQKDGKQKMALVFRWYLGNGSRWAIAGTPERQMDYQIWCGPAMGSFNAWVEGSFLAEVRNRTVGQIAANLLEGAAVVTRAQQMRTYGVAVPQTAFNYRPRPLQ
jgi:PfaD family protein